MLPGLLDDVQADRAAPLAVVRLCAASVARPVNTAHVQKVEDDAPAALVPQQPGPVLGRDPAVDRHLVTAIGIARLGAAYVKRIVSFGHDRRAYRNPRRLCTQVYFLDLDFPALASAIAIAWRCDRPAAISVRILDEMTFLEDPVLRGIGFFQQNIRLWPFVISYVALRKRA